MNLSDQMRLDLSTVVINSYIPTIDELQIERILDEHLQDEHPAQWRMKVFAKVLVKTLRHPQTKYENDEDPIDKQFWSHMANAIFDKMGRSPHVLH